MSKSADTIAQVRENATAFEMDATRADEILAMFGQVPVHKHAETLAAIRSQYWNDIMKLRDKSPNGFLAALKMGKVTMDASGWKVSVVR